MPLLSMTGFGDARSEQADTAVAVEVRTINSRHFKLSLRTTDGYGSLDSRIEGLLRGYIKRGTIYANVRIRHLNAAEDFRINSAVLNQFVDQLQQIAASRDLSEELRLEPLASLPGVVEELSAEAHDADKIWPQVEATLHAALEEHAKMRSAEGTALESDLRTQMACVSDCLDRIEPRTKLVAEHYRDKLCDRVNEMLAEFDVSVEPSDLVREVALFADRADITEEIVRLRSHLEQFEAAMQLADSAGRKLEFICQEMGRETNTIGSKANDASISADVVEIKTALERIREQIQNVQ